MYRENTKGRPPAAFLLATPTCKLRTDAHPRRCLSLWSGGSGSCGGGFVQNPMMDGEQRQFQPVRNADLVIDVAQVILDHLLGGSQLRCDLFVLVALNDQSNNPQLF